MTDEAQDSSNTIPKQLRGKTFKDHPERINRKGRPKSFDKLRELAVSLANEAAIDAATKGPLLVKGHAATEIEMLMRQMMHDNPARFVEIAFGKVPDEMNMNTKGEIIFKVVRDTKPIPDPSENTAS
jgi:hypothetical protein